MHETGRKLRSRHGAGGTGIRLLALTGLLALLLAGCALHGRKIRETAEGFLTALADTNAEEAQARATEDVLERQELAFLYPEKLEALLYEELGARNMQITEKDLTQEAQEALHDFAAVLSERAILDWSILELSEKEKVGTVVAEVTFGYPSDHEKLFDQSGNAAGEIEAYESEHREELLEIYTSQGEQAMNRKIYSDVIVIMASSMKEAVLNAEPHVTQLQLRVERVDDRWTVTDIEEYVTESVEDGNSN